MVINNVVEGKIIIGNAKAAQEQYFDSLIQLIERQDIQISQLMAENERLKSEEGQEEQ